MKTFATLGIWFLCLLPVLPVTAQEVVVNPQTQVIKLQLFDKTLWIEDPVVGSRVIYVGADGSLVRWQPGDGSVLVGQLNLQMLSGMRSQTTNGVTQNVPFAPMICLRYSGRKGVATKGRRYKTRLCDRWETFAPFIKDSTDGDIFDLSSFKVPCRLCRTAGSLAELRQKLGK